MAARRLQSGIDVSRQRLIIPRSRERSTPIHYGALWALLALLANLTLEPFLAELYGRSFLLFFFFFSQIVFFVGFVFNTYLIFFFHFFFHNSHPCFFILSFLGFSLIFLFSLFSSMAECPHAVPMISPRSRTLPQSD